MFFKQENYTNNENAVIYDKKCALYITEINKLIERGKDVADTPTGEGKSNHNKYQNLLKDLDQLLCKSVSGSAKFYATEEMKDKIPTDSAFLVGSDILQSDYNLVEEKIDQLYHELNSIENYFLNKKTTQTMKMLLFMIKKVFCILQK